MTWARMQPFLTNWPDGAPPPVFEISSDRPGAVVIELAWDPQALLAPAVYPEPLRYFTTSLDFAANGLIIPAQPIALTGATVQWAIPAGLWSAYTKEAAKVFDQPPGTTFACNLYYRVRVTPTGAGAGAASIWPADDVLSSGGAAAAPHIGILTPAGHNTAPVPDPAGVAAAGGTAAAPTQWADTVRWCWSSLAEADDARIALAALFKHPAFTSADVAHRGELLALWVLAGPSARLRLTELLDAVTSGGPSSRSMVATTSKRDAKSLVRALLDLAGVTPHPDLSTVLAKEQLVDDVITEILDPNGQLDLARAATCAAPAPQAWLIGVNPAEYARLQAGLLDPTGVATVADGTTITVPPGTFTAAPEATPLGDNVFVVRTNAELAFTAAVLARAQGNAFPSLAGTPAAANAALQSAVSAGMAIADLAAVLSALFGAPIEPRNVSWPPRPQHPPWLGEQTAVRDSLLACLAEHRSALVHLFWSDPPPAFDSITHAVLALSQDGDDVIVRNAQYAGSSPPSFAVAGGTAQSPPRTYRDPAEALEALTTDDLGAWIIGYLAPTAPLS